MSPRRVTIVLVCEDKQQSAFVGRVLNGLGWDKNDIRVDISPRADGSAEQWVRQRFCEELVAYRQRATRAASALIAVIDADTRSLQQRENQFREECTANHVEFRRGDEAVAIGVPQRNIETWIHYLNGTNVDETTEYPKLERQRDCKPATDTLVRMCKTNGLPRNAPTALGAACSEYNQRIKPLRTNA